MDALLTASDFASETMFSNLLYAAVACAAILALLGCMALYSARDVAEERMRRLVPIAVSEGMTKTLDEAPRGLLRGLLPEKADERAQIQFQLEKAGISGVNALRDFYLFRLLLALGLPLLTLLLVKFALGWELRPLKMLQLGVIAGAAGFYLPGHWLKSKTKARLLRIRNGFPNALDLLQISVESGLGFDAAIQRVGQEIARVSPEIATEFLTLQREIAAGRDRETAMFDMANRLGLEEAKSFVLVIQQSLQFGTSLTAALKNYAIEMRVNRELNAQEKANKLPVQMSAVMSLLMLPALFLITLTPIVIRFIGMDG
jgi:tight adherence protein C